MWAGDEGAKNQLNKNSGARGKYCAWTDDVWFDTQIIKNNKYRDSPAVISAINNLQEDVRSNEPARAEAAKNALDNLDNFINDIKDIINEAKPAEGRSNLELFNLILSHLNKNEKFPIGVTTSNVNIVKFNDNYNVKELTKIDSKKDKRYHRLQLINKNIKDKYDSLSSENSETANTFKNNLIQNLIKVIQKDSEYNSSPKSPFKKKIDEMIETFLSQQASQKDKSDDDDVDGVSPRPEPFVHGAAEHANRIKKKQEKQKKKHGKIHSTTH